MAAHCPAEVSARLRDEIEASDEVRVLAGHGVRIVLRTRSVESGLDGVTESMWLELDPQTCALVEMNEAIYNNLLFEAEIHDGSGGAAPWQLVRRFERPVEAYSPELVSHGLVGLLETGHASDLAAACSCGARDEPSSRSARRSAFAPLPKLV